MSDGAYVVCRRLRKSSHCRLLHPSPLSTLSLFVIPHEMTTVIRYAFIPGYHCSYEHGDNGGQEPPNIYQFDNHIYDDDGGGFDMTTYHEMLHNVAGPSFNWNHMEESPKPKARQLYDMIKASSKQLWSGCETMTNVVHNGEVSYDQVRTPYL
ncbi:hypothetical protein Syun_017334 [Stephania yunnanensis]|uniref:Uncharacterized protein n=1 Tax=Stephania yunnanensis TaxID=152371 RepID=A0AAP0J927_9MAGN